MSEETARRLEEAREREATQSAVVKSLTQDVLETIANGVADHVASHGKKVALGQPEVNKALGKERIQELRHELASAGVQLADQLRNAADKIKWPTPNSGLGSYAYRAALDTYASGRLTNPIDQILKSYGYEIDRYYKFDPNAMYTYNSFEPLVKAAEKHRSARSALSVAQRAHDDDIVSDLWDD